MDSPTGHDSSPVLASQGSCSALQEGVTGRVRPHGYATELACPPGSSLACKASILSNLEVGLGVEMSESRLSPEDRKVSISLVL